VIDELVCCPGMFCPSPREGGKRMRNGLFVAMLAVGFLLGMVPVAGAGEVVWHVLEDPAVALAGPGADLVIGVPGCPGTADDDDTSTGENNKCNFTNLTNCAGGTLDDPTNGTYSYGALEFAMAKSCLGGSNTGGSCVDDGDCPGGTCMECTANPSGFDSYYYAGDIGNANGNGTMTMCQEDGASSYEVSSFKLGGSEAQDGLGASCITLQPGGPYTGSPCGIGASTSTISVKTSVGACLFEVGSIDNLISTGRAYDVNDASPAPVCGYSTADILCLLNVAATSKGADYVLISCNDQTLPDPLSQTCLAGGRTVSVTVAWTTDDASDCTSACEGGGCVATTAENVK
jgi:hypothetical protein